MLIRRKYLFFGKVQEVGFRTIVMNMATVLHITGSIENQEDGSVVAFMQGKKENIETLINYLNNYPPFNITAIDYIDLEIEKKEIVFKLIDRYITK